MLNRVVLIGRLANDPEPKMTPSGIAVTTFRIAVNRPISAEARSQGTEQTADFIDIVAWRQNAEYAANYLSKGRLIAVEGKLQIREYVTQDGQRRRAAEVVADNIKGLDRAKEGEGEDSAGASSGGGYEQRSGGNARPQGGGYDQQAGGGGYGGNARGGNTPAPAPGAPARGGYDRAAPAPGGNRAPSGGRGGYTPPADNDPFDSDLSDPFAE